MELQMPLRMHTRVHMHMRLRTHMHTHMHMHFSGICICTHTHTHTHTYVLLTMRAAHVPGCPTALAAAHDTHAYTAASSNQTTKQRMHRKSAGGSSVNMAQVSESLNGKMCCHEK